MKYIIILMTALLPSLLFADPVIKVTPIDHNFGNILPGEKCLLDIEIKNEGDRDLTILAVEPQCGCTTVDLSQKTLAPNQSTKINLTMVANPSDGKMVKTVKITSNDPKKGTVVVTLTAQVKSDFALSSTKFDIGYLYPGDTKDFSFTLTPTSDLPIQIQELKYNSTAVKIEYKKNQPDNPLSVYTFTATFDTQKDRPGRRAYESILIYPYGGENKDKFLKVEITGWVKPNVVVQPSNNIFKLVNKGEAATTIATISHKKNRPFNVTSIESDNENISITLLPKNDKENQNQEVEITLKEGSTAKSENALIKFKTDLAEAPNMSFSISFTFKR